MLAQQSKSVWKKAHTLELTLSSRLLGSGRLAQLWLSSPGGRGFSAQPAPVESYAEELNAILPEPQQQSKVPQAFNQSIGKWDRFVYTLYHLRARVSAEAAVVAGAEGSSETYMSSLLPVTLLLDPKSRGRHPLSEWIRELQKELDCQALTRQKLEEKVDSTLRRGGATELRSSYGLVRQLQGPMTDAIIREQRAVLRGDANLDRRTYGPFLLLAPAQTLAQITIHRILSSSLMSGTLGLSTLTKTAIEIGRGVKAHVNTELANAKSKRLRAQHQKLQKKLKSGETPTSYKDWLKEFGIPLDAGPHDEAFNKKLLDTCLALKASDLPDPARWNPQDPVSDVAIALTASKDSMDAASRDDERWAADEQGVLDVVEARAYGLPLRGRKRKLTGTRRTIAKLQEHLNRLLVAARTWNTIKEAKIGVRLIDLAMQTLFISKFDPQAQQRVSVPILEHHMISEATLHHPIKVTGMLKIHDDLVNRLADLTDIIYLQNSIFDPMIVPPLPWKGNWFGGHLLQHDMVVRLKSTSAQLGSINKADNEIPGLSKIYDSLNCLQSVPWRINQKVLEVARQILKGKEEICGIPRRHALPILPVKKRHRFITWAGGSVPDALTDYAKAEEDMLDAISTGYRNRNYGTGQIKRAWHETQRKLTRQMQGQPEPVSAYVANMEPNVPSLTADADEGTNLWRHRVRANRRRFMRKQLLVTSSTGETLQELKHRRIKNADIRKLNRETYSQMCDLNVKLAVGEKYKHEKAIYFPHNLDFRGRAYTLHPHLTHLGSDICRGILEFAEGRPLGEHGLEWLLVKFSNTWGQGEDKRSFEGRRQFALEHLFDIMESGRAPMEHTWWQQAEDPFQALAAALDIRAAIESGDPARYVSHTPVMMDGSCNGLQHYAALGLDKEGGSAVNLVRANKPQDVYTEVVRLVKESATLDAVNGSVLAQRLLPFLDRQLVKQTVMTSVYGVTMLGAKDQIAGKLRDRGLDKIHSNPAGAYAAQKTLNGLNLRFKEAMRVMAWLSACATAVAASGQLVQWKTPLGLPVVQPYRSLPKLHVQTTLQRVILTNDVQEAKINRGKQRTAFPPNFVHSVDSTHMLMTAAACTKAGLHFAGVHDSFWTHAQSVPVLNRILREQFIELYSQPILENLQKQLQEQYPGVTIPELPQKGDLDIHTLMDATYFFS